MSVEILLPKLEFSMSEGTLNEWLAAENAIVQQGSPLFSLESGKAVEEIEAPASGKLRILAKAGGTYPVGTVIGIIEA
jgi:pyruvate/2-oxoglutarate dehydrogenase complex dihydrolipoamide acyltransferase (E2) component